MRDTAPGPRHDVIQVQVEAGGRGSAVHAPETVPVEDVRAKPLRRHG